VNNVNVVAIRNDPPAAFDTDIRLVDFAKSIGPFNVEGNIYEANGTNLNVDKTVGSSYRVGNNFHTDKASPDITTDSAETALEWNYSYRDGIGGYTLPGKTDTIIPGNYDNGTVTLGTVGVNSWTVQIIKHLPGSAGHRIEYGQATFTTDIEALAAIPDINHLHNPAFVDGIVRGYLVVRGGATNLSTVNDATFIEAAKFTSAGGASTIATGSAYELIVAGAAQTVFNLTFPFSATVAGRTYIQVFVDGVKQAEGAS